MRTPLGQNFLHDLSIVKKIIQSAHLAAKEVVLEIGPGKGIMTQELAPFCQKVIAIEIDRDLVELLKKKFKNTSNVEIIQGDILKINIPELVKHCPAYKVIANLPYYITSAIIRLFLENSAPPAEMILMVQKEVARRIVAKPGNMSLLSVSVQYYAEPEILFEVSRQAFSPVPEVDSAVIKISHIQKLSKNKTEIKQFFAVGRAGFSAKRKTLCNNLANSFHMEKEMAEEKIRKAEISPAARAQELGIEDWERLVKQFFTKETQFLP